MDNFKKIKIKNRNNDVFCYLNGKLHSNNGKPSAIYTNGSKRWHKHGKLHREDGPAAMYPTGNISWWLDDYNYSFKEYVVKAGWSDEQIVMYKLEHF